MKQDQCAFCGAEINEAGVEFRGLLFCSDECCEDYEDDLTVNGEPNPDELDPDELEDMDLDGGDFEEDELSDNDYDYEDDYNDDY